MRIRTIKPGFFTHEEISELSPLARILFIGLWCMADVSGRMEDRPKRIKVEILPYDKVDADALLNELQGRGFIERYQSEGVRIIQVNNFEKHQRISGKEAQTVSEYPVKQPGSIGEAPNASQSGSGLVPESQEGKGREGKGREGNEEGKGVSRSSRARDADAIYAIYPKKKARIDALKAIEKAMKTIPVEILVEAVTAYAQAVSTWAPEEKQFIPDPSTWFNQGRWEDDRSTWEKRKSTIIAPSEEDWITECKRLNRSRANYEPEWPFETARAEFLRNQANGWRFVTDWKACAGAAHSKFLGMEAANQDRRSR